MAGVDRTRYQLSEKDNEQIFREDIVPADLAGTYQAHPVVVFIAGQTGAGKTSVTNLVETVLSRRGTVVNINLDTYKPFHPRYQRLIENDDSTAGAYTSIDGHKWMEKAEAYATEQRYDVVMESAMRDPRDFEEPARRFRAAGYQVEVVIVAVHASLSRLGALDRYLQQVNDHGRGRVIDAVIHNACYDGVLRSAEAIDAERLADRIFVSRRNGQIVYTNHLDATGNWASPATTRAAIDAERNRSWTEQESHQFLGNLQRLQQLAHSLPAAAQRMARPEAKTVAQLAGELVADAACNKARTLASDMPIGEEATVLGLLAASNAYPPAAALTREQRSGADRPIAGSQAGIGHDQAAPSCEEPSL